MSATKQISIFLENRPGELARIGDILSRHRINIQAISVSDTVDFGVIRIVADEHEEAKKVLRQEGLSFVEVDVLAIETQNRPGALAQIAHKLSKAKVNVEYVYSGASDEKGFARIVLRVSNLARAKQALGTR